MEYRPQLEDLRYIFLNKVTKEGLKNRSSKSPSWQHKANKKWHHTMLLVETRVTSHRSRNGRHTTMLCGRLLLFSRRDFLIARVVPGIRHGCHDKTRACWLSTARGCPQRPHVCPLASPQQTGGPGGGPCMLGLHGRWLAKSQQAWKTCVLLLFIHWHFQINTFTFMWCGCTGRGYWPIHIHHKSAINWIVRTMT